MAIRKTIDLLHFVAAAAAAAAAEGVEWRMWCGPPHLDLNDDDWMIEEEEEEEEERCDRHAGRLETQQHVRWWCGNNIPQILKEGPFVLCCVCCCAETEDC